VARQISGDLDSGGPREPSRRESFVYKDKGEMATIGRSAAIAKIGKLKLSGTLAWLAWLVLHLLFLVGLRNRVSVFIHWCYSYFSYKQGARIIMGLDRLGPPLSDLKK
jgi:NADH dehydrogenase